MIPLFLPFISNKAIRAATRVMNTRWLGDGAEVVQFEKDIQRTTQSKHVVVINSATSGLHLALRLAGVSGGEVITTPMTCVATNMPILHEGARIVWADINPHSGNINSQDIERKITKKTKAIVVVHWGGNPCDLRSINAIAKKNQIPVIEDAAQAFGAEYQNKPIGSHSDFVVLSFQSIKIITTIDGGALAIKNNKLFQRAKALRWYGIDREKRKTHRTYWNYPIAEVGCKYTMNNVSAAIGRASLPYLPKLLKRRRQIATIYTQALYKHTLLKSPEVLPESNSSWWLYTVICKNQKVREKLWKTLRDHNIESSEVHTRNDLYPVFKTSKKERLPGVEQFNRSKLCIPIGWWVSIKDAQRIASILHAFTY